MRRTATAVILATAVAIGGGCAQLGGLVGMGGDLAGEALPVAVTDIFILPADGVTFTPGQSQWIPALAIRANVDLGKLNTPLAYKGTMAGWVIINGEPGTELGQSQPATTGAVPDEAPDGE